MVRLWAKVRIQAPSECWEWFASKNNKGYGLLWSPEHGRKALAHRLVYEDAHGSIPPGAFILHSCDNPACVNPAHLRAGDARDNIRDMDERGRRNFTPMRGEDNGQSKMTDAAVIALRRDYIGGMPRRDLAAKYGLSVPSIDDYTTGGAWAHLTEGPTRDELKAARRLKAGAKITVDAVRDIKRRLAAGETGRSIAKLHGIHFGSVSDIKTGKTWADV